MPDRPKIPPDLRYAEIADAYHSHLILTDGSRRFELLEKIGVGSTGEIWKAISLSETENLGLPVFRALKLLPTVFYGDGDNRHILRLKREVVQASAINHHNVLTVLGWREDAEKKLPFIEMEWLDGRDFGSLLEERLSADANFSQSEVLELIKPVCDALEHVWQVHKMVHRDITPGNLFRGNNGTVKILNFGISSSSQDTRSIFSMDREQMLASTEDYMAAELQANCKPHPSQDVFSLAAVIYELIAGTPPFNGFRTKTTVAAKPKHMSERFWTQLKAGLSYQPESRPQSASAFYKSLQTADLADGVAGLLETERETAQMVAHNHSTPKSIDRQITKAGWVKKVSAAALVGVLAVGGYSGINQYQQLKTAESKLAAVNVNFTALKNEHKQLQTELTQTQATLQTIKAKVAQMKAVQQNVAVLRKPSKSMNSRKKDIALGQFVKTVNSLISNNYRAPLNLRCDMSMVLVKLNNSGFLKGNPRVKTSSGDDVCDTALINAALRSEPFPMPDNKEAVAIVVKEGMLISNP